ncbi:hypothetical protein HN903_01965 [archaeon]|nr:hypothetical protein [archaeon]MBT7128499.1 hypothetical protein [archaeon]
MKVRNSIPFRLGTSSKSHFKRAKILWTGVLAAVLMIVVNMLLNVIYSKVFPGITEMYSSMDVFRSMGDPLMMLFFIYPLVLGIGLAWIWSYTKGIFKKDSTFWAGLKFGWAYFVIAGIPIFFINVGSFDLPIMMIGTWVDMLAANGLIAGWVFAKWAR